ncbi:MAG: C40 family peptidase [Spirochaetales bacterium]|nr:C40 family peptidase [Spirochaetales bacterium]
MHFFKIIFLLTVTFAAAVLNAADNFLGTTQFSDAELSKLFATDKKAENDRIKFIQGLREYLGVPYAYGGITKNEVDCSGLLYAVSLEATGKPLPRTSTAMYRKFERVPKSQLRPGDAVFFATDGTITVTHVGVYLGDNYFIHAQSFGSDKRVIISDLNAKYWKGTFYSGGKIFDD